MNDIDDYLDIKSGSSMYSYWESELAKKYGVPLQTTGDVVSYLKFGENIYHIGRKIVEFKEEIYTLKEFYKENKIIFDELNDEIQQLIDSQQYWIKLKTSLTEFENFLKSRCSR